MNIHKYMKETAKEVDRYIIEFLEKEKKENKNLPFEIVSHLPKLRTSTKGVPKIRATFGRLLYEMLAPKKDWKKILPILSSIEFYAISTYVLDDIFDNQPIRQTDLATWKKYGLNRTIIAGILQRDIAAKMLLDLKTSKGKKLEILSLFEKADYLLYIGQDINEKITSEINEKRYVERSTALTNENPAMARMIGICLGINKKYLNIIEDLGRKFGTLAMMRNDFMNLVPEKVKKETTTSALKGKTYEDLRKGLYTYPIIKFFKKRAVLKKDKEFIKKILGNWDADKKDLEKVVKLLIKSGAIKSFVSFIKKYEKETMKFLRMSFKEKDLGDFKNFFLLFENVDPYYKLIRKMR